jgi:hypothetical protein
MRSMTLGLAAAAVMGALTATAQAADCKRIGAVGQMLTHDTAVLFSTNALKNTIASKGLIGQGPVKTTCTDEGASTTCRSSQMACTGGTPKSCLGAWLCF